MKKAWMLVLFVGALLGTAENAAAMVRVVIRPWYPRAIVVGPRFVPRRAPGVVVVPAVPRDSAMAYLDLQVQPGDAEILINGEYNGTASDFAAENDGVDLEPGQHTVTIQKQGYKTQNFYLKAQPGRTIQLDVRLSPLSASAPEAPGADENIQVDLEQAGNVLLKVEPADATIYIDDTNYGPASEFAAENAAIALRAGAHRVEIVRPGYRPFTSTVEVKPNESSEVTVTLERAGQ